MSQPPQGTIERPSKQSGWWKIDTRPGQSVDDIQAEFRTVFESGGSPVGAALFCNHVLLERTTLFVTPQAVSLAARILETYGGGPCEDPMEGIFLVGNDADRVLLPVPELSAPPAEPHR